MKRWFTAAAAGFLLCASTAASAATITIGSGLGLSGTVQDPQVEVSTDGGATWFQATATDAGPWAAPLVGTLWDSPNPLGGFGDPQLISYRVTFTLPAAGSATLTGSLSNDDQPVSVSLNGTTINTYPYQGYIYDPSYHPFGTTDASLFKVGANVVVLTGLNLGGATGINFQAVVSYTVPATKDDCKNGGWQAFGFKNQGQCVSFVETGKH